jgi:hypothetical protein
VMSSLAPEKAWMHVTHANGEEAVKQVYLTMLDGGSAPEEGHVLSLS